MNFIDLHQQYQRYKQEILGEIEGVLESSAFINGPAVREFEGAMALHIGAKHAIGCSSGTDALLIALLALDVQQGDEVIIPDFTFFATAETVAFLQAVPVFTDIRMDTYNIDPDLIEAKINERTKGIIAVSLFGQCADFDEINAIAANHGLWVIEDGAQSYGAEYRGRKSGTLCRIGTTSFYPAKPLGCYGDGGAIFTGDDQLASKMRMILNHGQSGGYEHKILGINGRLDTMQAAILKIKLKHFEVEMQRKREIAEMYDSRLQDYVVIPILREYNKSVWAQYSIRSPKRNTLQEGLKSKNIPTAVHYPRPLHCQEVFSALRIDDGDFPIAMRVSDEICSLPMHPFLTEKEVTNITDAVKSVIDEWCI